MRLLHLLIAAAMLFHFAAANSAIAQTVASRRAPGIDPGGVDRDVLKTDPIAEQAPADETDTFLTYFYLNPKPDEFVYHFREIARSLEFQADANSAALSTFFGYIMRQYPERIGGWADELADLPPTYKPVLYYSLGHADCEEARNALRRLADAARGSDQRAAYGVLAVKTPNLLTREIRTGAHLDALWGAFLATGDERFVKRIIGVLAWLDDKSATLHQRVVAEAAKWSLTSNAWQHSRVLRFCRDALPDAPATTAVALREIIAQTEQALTTKPCPEPKPATK